MKFNQLSIGFAVFSMTVLVSLNVSAAGIWLYETGTPEMGTASVGRDAIANSASTATYNPAGMTRLDRDELMVGVQPLYVKARFDIDEGSGSGGGDGGNAGGWVPAGSFNYVQELSPELKFGIASGSYFGLGLDFNSDWGGRYFATEIEVMTMVTAFNLGYKMNENLSIGGGANVLYGSLTQKMDWNNDPLGTGKVPDGELKIKDSDVGYGFNLGALYEFSSSTRIGMTYISEIELKFEDAVDTSRLNGLPGQILNDAKVDLNMTVPQAVSMSIFHQLDEQWSLLGSLGWQDWSNFGKTDIKTAQNGGGTDDRNYDDTWSAGVGFHYQWSEPWKLMAGIQYDTAPVSKSDRTIDQPFDRQIRYGVGAQYEYSDDLTLSAAYEFWDAGSAKIDQSGPSGTLKGEFESYYVHFINVNASWKF